MQAEALRSVRRADDPMSEGRKGKQQIGAFFDEADIATLQQVLATERQKRGRKVTMQEAMQEMVAEYCKKHGVTLPSSKRPAKD
jgi:hypothetical protein